MAPVRLLSCRWSICKSMSLEPRSWGTRPWSWLKLRSMVVSLVQDVKFAGRSPVRVLFCMSRAQRWCKWPILTGMAPLNALELRFRTLRDDRLPIAGER